METFAKGGPAGTEVHGLRQRKVSMAEYREHLQSAMQLVDACAQKRDLTTCDPLQVGPDDLVPLGADGKSDWRLVRYGWLRVLLFRAQDPEEPANTNTTGSGGGSGAGGEERDEPATKQLLQEAKARLARDLAQSSDVSKPPPSYPRERATMLDVLSGRDFRDLQQPTATDYWKEKLNAWLNRFFERAAQLRAGSAWVGRAVVAGFLLAVCAGLVWVLLQLERRWRQRLKPEGLAPVTGAQTERDWDRWLNDARDAAAAGEWRRAIHAAYWAVIARLESQWIWPADKAKTPREVLKLMEAEDPRREDLVELTRTFEYTWYGGRAADAADFARAERLASALIAGEATPQAQCGGVR